MTKYTFLIQVRLSTFFWLLFSIFFVASAALPGFKFDSSALTLFSVNSFLYGFYIAPILSAQKSRIEELHKIVRLEANALFSIMLRFKKLPEELRSDLQAMVRSYVNAKLRHRKVGAGEKEYEELITFCLNYKGSQKEIVDETLEKLIANQLNRTNFSMQYAYKVFTNEWYIMAILFSITLGFILLIDISDTPLLHIVRALLCTGLSMLILILLKLSTLTHKRAHQIWNPLVKLRDTDFYRID